MTVRTQEWVACSDVDAVIRDACSKLAVVQEQGKRLVAENMRFNPTGLLSEVVGKSYILDELISRLKTLSTNSEYGTLAPKARPQE